MSEDTVTIFEFVFYKDLGTFAINLNWIILTALALLAFAPLFIRWWSLRGSYELDEAEFGIGSQKVKFKSNFANLQIAYKMWVELSTRKVGLVVDPAHDVISEVYDSWYGFFGVMRELLKEIPAQTLRRDKSARDLVAIAGRILNDELRPHLTEWQARYRRWYDHELLDGSKLTETPQQIQSRFPEFSEITVDLQRVNKILIGYRLSLERIVLSGKRYKLWQERLHSEKEPDSR
jgi:hypothetical protein